MIESGPAVIYTLPKYPAKTTLWVLHYLVDTQVVQFLFENCTIVTESSSYFLSLLIWAASQFVQAYLDPLSGKKASFLPNILPASAVVKIGTYVLMYK